VQGEGCRARGAWRGQQSEGGRVRVQGKNKGAGRGVQGEGCRVQGEGCRARVAG